MAIIIPKSKIINDPDIELITDNRVRKVDYDNNVISSLKDEQVFKKVLSKNIIAWKSVGGDSSHLVYKTGYNDEHDTNLMWYVDDSGNNYFYCVIDLLKTKSDFYYSIKEPYNKAYIEIKYNYADNINISKYIELNPAISSSITNIEQKPRKLTSSNTYNQSIYNLYTTPTSPTNNQLMEISSLFNGIWQFDFKSSNENIDYYVDEISGKIYFGLGEIPSSSDGIIITSLDINLYYPSFEFSKENKTLGETNSINSYTMETNTFMNSYINASDTEVNFVDKQAQGILNDYGLGKLRANISCLYGEYKNDDGTIAYSGKNGETIKVNDIVQLELPNINKNFLVLKSEINYNGSTEINLTLEETQNNFSIIQSISGEANVTYTRLSSLVNAKTGIINKDTKLYEGDIIQIDISYNTNAYNLESFIVNGSNFSSGNLITVGDKDLSVSVTTKVKTFSVNSTVGNGATLQLYRLGSQYGGGSIGNVTTNDTFYYGDIVKVSWTLDSGYGTDTAFINNERIYPFNENKITITSNTTIIINTKLIGYQTIWNGEYDYRFSDLTSNETTIQLPTSINTQHGVRLTFSRVVLYNINENASADEITNITRDIPFTLSSEFGSWWNSKPSITFEFRNYSGETTNQLKTIRIPGSYNSQQYIVGSFKLTKIEQYYD